MGDKTAIEWTDATWNPTTGCDRVSPGCDNCYALTLAKRLKAMGSSRYQNDGDPRTSGPGFKLTTHDDALDQPVRWKRPRRIFVNSMSDLFHRDVDLDFINDVWRTMLACPQHTFQILTKRSQRMMQLLSGEIHGMQHTYNPWVGFSRPLPNVWLGVSIENDRYKFRADHLRNTPAAVRFLSLEPLLGPLPDLNLDLIDWVIVGGESGPGARPMHPDWVRDIRDQCIDTGTPFLFKQWGEWAPEPTRGIAWSLYEPNQVGRLLPRQNVTKTGSVYRTCAPEVADYFSAVIDENTSKTITRQGKKAAGRELDGRTWDEFPVGADQ